MKILATTAALAAIAALTGCGLVTTNEPPTPGYTQGLQSSTDAESVTESVTVQTPTGSVECIVLFDGTSLQRSAVEMECDW